MVAKMKKIDFLLRLEQSEPLVGDGAMGTELQKRGSPAGGCPEELNLTQPDLIREIHRDYFAAGSDLVETNTFGGTRARLAMPGFADRAGEFSRRAAALARSVCPAGKFVAGSIGPTGLLLEPYGTSRVAEAEAMFAEQAEALAGGGVDVLFVETMMAIEEAECAVRAAKQVTRLPVAATMTFEAGKSGVRTKWGVAVPTAVQRLCESGADIIGSNCGRGFDEMVLVMEEMRALTAIPLLAQANAGLPTLSGEKVLYSETPDRIAAPVQRLLALGVNIIGGCCGTGPAHIRKIRQLVDAVPRS